MLLTLDKNDSLSGLENIYDDQLRRRNGQDVHELGSLVSALTPNVKKFLTAKAENLIKKVPALVKQKTQQAQSVPLVIRQQKPVQSLPVRQIIEETLKPYLDKMIRQPVTEFVPAPKPQATQQIIQPLQPQTNDNQKLLIGLGVGAGVVVLLGFTYAITRRQPTQLSGLPSIKIGRHPKKLKKLKNLKTIKAL